MTGGTNAKALGDIKADMKIIKRVAKHLVILCDAERKIILETIGCVLNFLSFFPLNKFSISNIFKNVRSIRKKWCRIVTHKSTDVNKPFGSKIALFM